MLSRVWTLHPEGFAGNERVMCPQYLSKVTWSVAYARLVDRPVRCAAGSVEARKADLLRRTIGSLVDTGHGAVRGLSGQPENAVNRQIDAALDDEDQAEDDE